MKKPNEKEALNVNNTKAKKKNEKTEPDWQLFDQLLHYNYLNSPYGAAGLVGEKTKRQLRSCGATVTTTKKKEVNSRGFWIF